VPESFTKADSAYGQGVAERRDLAPERQATEQRLPTIPHRPLL